MSSEGIPSSRIRCGQPVIQGCGTRGSLAPWQAGRMRPASLPPTPRACTAPALARPHRARLPLPPERHPDLLGARPQYPRSGEAPGPPRRPGGFSQFVPGPPRGPGGLLSGSRRLRRRPSSSSSSTKTQAFRMAEPTSIAPARMNCRLCIAPGPVRARMTSSRRTLPRHRRFRAGLGAPEQSSKTGPSPPPARTPDTRPAPRRSAPARRPEAR